MNETDAVVRTTLRIPGDWPHPAALVERLPQSCRITGESLVLPDGSDIEIVPMPPDDQFPQIFESSCRQPPTKEELTTVRRYTVNIGLKGPGGSLAAARTMLEAGAAIVRAGGAGVFIDNSALSHGGNFWLEMAEDGGPDAACYAFVAIVRSRQDLSTMGMHVLGYPDLVMRHEGLETAGDTLVEVIRYISTGEKPVDDGHLLCDEQGPRFQARRVSGDEWPSTSPLHNPFGRLRLTSIREIAAEN